jgi:hypothetical protein
MWCIPRLDGEYVARMEDVLDLYAEAPDPKRPAVCFDESPVQLIGEVRQPIPAEPGQLERYDYEYRRNGTVNLFVCIDVHRPWREVKVTERRAGKTSPSVRRFIISGSLGCEQRAEPPSFTVSRSRLDMRAENADAVLGHPRWSCLSP